MELVQHDLLVNFLFNISVYPISCFLWRAKLILQICSNKLWPIILILRIMIVAMVPVWVIIGKPVFIDYENYYIPSLYKELANIYEFIRIMMILFLSLIVFIKQRQYEDKNVERIDIEGYNFEIYRHNTGKLELWHLLWWLYR
jgi:hypothetical protein